ncbi:MAG: acyl carrier protein [Lachnospiraceae bacterium]|nr:acyl carrier protein [Lachnospiraceae bacterium]
MNEVLEKINEVFRNIFEKENLVISEDTSADDIEGWDSLQHVKILVMLEQEFHVEFDIDEIISMDNIGDMVRIIKGKM